MSQELGLYYDGASGTYFYYNEGTNQFEYHSQAEFPEEEVAETEGQTTASTPALPAAFSNIPFPSLKPPPPPLPPKSPPPPARAPEKKKSSRQEEPKKVRSYQYCEYEVVRISLNFIDSIRS